MYQLNRNGLIASLNILVFFGCQDSWNPATPPSGGNAPTVSCDSAVILTPSSIQLKGSVNPHGVATMCQFECGTDSGYGITSAWQNVGQGNSLVRVRARLDSLAHGARYHWRIVALSDVGRATGPDTVFTMPHELIVPENVGTTYTYNHTGYWYYSLSDVGDAWGVHTWSIISKAMNGATTTLQLLDIEQDSVIIQPYLRGYSVDTTSASITITADSIIYSFPTSSKWHGKLTRLAVWRYCLVGTDTSVFSITPTPGCTDSATFTFANGYGLLRYAFEDTWCNYHRVMHATDLVLSTVRP
jgi:hypothetical protein